MVPEHEFAIPVSNLDAGGQAFAFPLRAAWIRGALEDSNVEPAGTDGKLEIRLSKSGTDVVVRGSIRADLIVPCGRCLEPARVTVAEAISTLAVPHAAMRDARSREGQGGEADLPPEDADMIPYDGDTLVLDDLVRDELLLGIPMIPLCSEGCEGISPPAPALAGQSPEPPAEESIDPRLRPLLRLKKSLT
jgi:uncharacterized protein